MICKSKRYLIMSVSEKLELQLFNGTTSAHTIVTAAKLDGNGPFTYNGENYYQIFVSVPKHHRVNAKGGVSPFAGQGYNLSFYVIGMNSTTAQKLLESQPTVEIETYGVDAKTLEPVLAHKTELKEVTMVPGSLTESTQSVSADGSTSLPCFSCTVKYSGGTDGKVGGDQFVLAPNMGISAY